MFWLDIQTVGFLYSALIGCCVQVVFRLESKVLASVWLQTDFRRWAIRMTGYFQNEGFSVLLEDPYLVRNLIASVIRFDLYLEATHRRAPVTLTSSPSLGIGTCGWGNFQLNVHLGLARPAFFYCERVGQHQEKLYVFVGLETKSFR